MSSYNKVILVGNLTRDPEIRTFANGGKVANFTIAVNERKKNQQTGQWEDSPVFVDCAAFNSESGQKLADLMENYCSKGKKILVDGKLTMDQWQDKATGDKRSKMKVTCFTVSLLSPKDNESPPAKDNAEFRKATGQEEPQSSPFEDESIPF